MKPRYSCSECQAEIHWGDRYCTSCGVSVEWAVSPPADLAAETTDRSSSTAPPIPSPQTITCKLCGTENPAAAERCETCGADLGVKREAAPGQPSVQASRTAREPAEKRERRRGSDKRTEASGPLFSWRTIAAFTLFLAAGVFVLDRLTPRQPVPHVHTNEGRGGAANMQALSRIEELEKQLAAAPNDSKLMLELANLLHDNRFTDKAIRMYAQYLERNPTDPDARVDLGVCYFDAGRLEEAKSQMEEALRHDPKHVLAHFNLGIVSLRAGRLQEANEWFRKTIDLAPNTPVGQQAREFLVQHSNPQTLQTN